MDLTLDMRERAGVSLGEEAIAEIATMRDLLRAAVGGGPRDVAPLERPEALLSEEQQRRWLEPAGAVVHSLDITV
jgi:hypothetical protein